MTEQAEPSESKESKTPAALARWPRDLTDLWAGWPPFGALGWPFRDIKVEEFIDGDHLVIRAELPGVDPDRDIDVSVDNGVLTIAAERQESTREKLEKGYRRDLTRGGFCRIQGRRFGDQDAQAHTRGSLPSYSDSARLMGTADVLSILISGGNDDGDGAVTGRARSVAAAPGVAP